MGQKSSEGQKVVNFTPQPANATFNADLAENLAGRAKEVSAEWGPTAITDSCLGDYARGVSWRRFTHAVSESPFLTGERDRGEIWINDQHSHRATYAERIHSGAVGIHCFCRTL